MKLCTYVNISNSKSQPEGPFLARKRYRAKPEFLHTAALIQISPTQLQLFIGFEKREAVRQEDILLNKMSSGFRSVYWK